MYSWQEVGSSYHPKLRDSLEAAGYEGQFLQKVMIISWYWITDADLDNEHVVKIKPFSGAWHRGGRGHLLEKTGFCQFRKKYNFTRTRNEKLFANFGEEKKAICQHIFKDVFCFFVKNIKLCKNKLGFPIAGSETHHLPPTARKCSSQKWTWSRPCWSTLS